MCKFDYSRFTILIFIKTFTSENLIIPGLHINIYKEQSFSMKCHNISIYKKEILISVSQSFTMIFFLMSIFQYHTAINCPYISLFVKLYEFECYNVTVEPFIQIYIHVNLKIPTSQIFTHLSQQNLSVPGTNTVSHLYRSFAH